MTDVKCKVNSCHYWGTGDVCKADKIMIDSDQGTGKSRMEAASFDRGFDQNQQEQEQRNRQRDQRDQKDQRDRRLEASSLDFDLNQDRRQQDRFKNQQEQEQRNRQRDQRDQKDQRDRRLEASSLDFDLSQDRRQQDRFKNQQEQERNQRLEASHLGQSILQSGTSATTSEATCCRTYRPKDSRS